MANEITGTENILVEFAEQNVVLVDPNKILDGNGEPQERLVKHENLTMYVNLQARVVPRSKVISGAGVETEALVDIFEGDINFMKPGGKDYLTSDWTDTMTGGGDENGPFNQKVNTATRDPLTGKDYSKETIINKRDPESFGIENIQISLNSAYIPTVTINFVDVRGKTLFEQGENSPYAAFFQLPYPLFMLTVKGFYGKAVKYQLMMHKFNATFDPASGNYNVTCNFIGRVSALLADITIQEIMNAPYMYPRQYESNSQDGGVQKITTTRGAQVQNEVFNIYRRKGLVDENFKDMTVRELVIKISTLETAIENALKNYNLDALDDIDSYTKFLDNYTTRILGQAGWRNKFLDMTQNGIYVDRGGTDYMYYTWKKAVAENEDKKQEAIDSLKKYIKEGNLGLLKNMTFGEDKEEFIPVDIKYEYFVADKVAGMPETTNEWFIFKGPTNSFEEKLGVIQTKFNQKKIKIEKNLSSIINRVVSGNEGLGFRPTIRNLFAVVLAGTDTFLRLMNETHLKSMSLRENEDRLNALKGSGAPDAQLQADQFVYPWPAYYVRQDNEYGGQNFVSTYPGAPSVTTQTKAYLPDVWPEVEFVEEYLRSMTIRERFPQISGENSALGEDWSPVTAADFQENELYADTSYVPFYYELWDRSVLHTFYSGIYTRFMDETSYPTFQAMSTIECVDMKTKTTGSFDLQEQLKNQSLEYNSFSTAGYEGNNQSFLQSLAPLTKWQLLLRDEINTPYIRTMINDARASFYPFIDLISTNYGNEDTATDRAIIRLKEYLTYPKNDTDNLILDTFPFRDFNSSEGIDGNSIPWVKRNLAGGSSISSFQELYNISKSLTVSENLRTFTSQIKTEGELSSFGAAPFYSNPKVLLPNFITTYDNMLITRYQTIIDNKPSWQGFYDDASQPQSEILNNNKLLLTESTITYGGEKSNITPDNKQIVSMLNTPYFVNAFREGVLNDFNSVSNPYINAAYLLLNSLPLASLRDKTLLDVNNGTTQYGDYIFATLNQVSAIHPLPYAWILKYGSIWNRYKTYVQTGTDTLANVWTDYNAGQGFNPSTNSLNYLYNLNIGENNSPVALGAEQPAGGGFTKINLGFYPELVNLTHYFVTGDLLYNNTTITGLAVTSPEINQYILGGALNLQKNTDITLTPPVTNGQDLSVEFWNAFYDTTADLTTSGYTEPNYIIYPSSGGLKRTQLKFELEGDYLNKKSTHNGNVRFLWPMSQYGYFEHDNRSQPKPWQYIDKVDPNTDSQSPFTIVNDGTYNSIEELFDIFSPDILDKFEEYFLNFCENENNFDDTLDGLEYFNSENSDNSLNSSNLTTTNGMTFQSVVRELLVVPQHSVTPANNNSDFGVNMAKAQNSKISSTLRTLLNKKLSFKFYNQNDIDLKVFRTISGERNYYDFGSYQGNLPPNVTVATSQANYPAEWDSLALQVGFFDDPELPTLHYNDLGSEITDFFISLDVDFTQTNIRLLRKVIRMYVTERIRQQPVSSTRVSSAVVNANTVTPYSEPTGFLALFKEKITQLINGLEGSQAVHINEVFLQSKTIFDKVPVRAQIDDVDPVFKTDVQKLEIYQTFKTLNDKWIAGEEFGDKTLFQDFLFFDRANRDIGDKAIIDVEPFKLLSMESNANTTLLGFIGAVLKENNFHFLPLPSYINFYGVTNIDGEEVSKFNTSDEANALFGTHMEVDYLDSAPKFLCMYVGEPSQHINVQSDIYRYDTDSFLLGRTSDNPLFSNCSDPTKCNKVVAFNVDFGVQNQGVFKGVSLDQNEFRNTAESFRLTQQLADSSNDKTISTQGLNLFNIYRSRSYTAKISAMGNACIQPTMYFNLRYVPMFSGPYLITDVEHNITPNNMETSFTGIRSPFFDLPNIEDIVSKVNKSFIERVKGKVVTDVQVSGFGPEGIEKDTGPNPPAVPMSGKITMIILHSTGNVELGNNPVATLNVTHKDLGFAGVAFHYLVDRNPNTTQLPSILTARPDTYQGAHTLDANANTLSIALISNCTSDRPYGSTTGELSTASQNTVLERFIILQFFKLGILRITKDITVSPVAIQLAIMGPEGTTVWPKNVPSPLNGIAGETYKQILRGHNDFGNKKCPCFKVQNALDGKLKDKLNTNLKFVWPELLNFAINNVGLSTTWNLEDGMSYIKPNLIEDMIAKKLNITIKPTLISGDFVGTPQSYNSGS